MQFIWLGHGSLRIETGEAVLLIDPWLSGNPSLPDAQHEAAVAGATHILLTHAWRPYHRRSATGQAVRRTRPRPVRYDEPLGGT